MKSPYVGEIAPNDVVTALFLVTHKEIRQKKTGEPYLSLVLADKTGELEAKMWDNVAEVMDTFDRDHFVKVKGLLQIYQKRTQFTVHRLRRLEEHEVDLADFFPCSDRDPEEMFAELRGIIAGLGSDHLKALLTAVFNDPAIATAFKAAPAAKNIHHACRGGLLQHVLSLCGLARLIGTHYEGVDLDLLLTGALLHDIGKIEELTYARSFGYSADGQLLGHIVIGLRIVGDKVRLLPDFPPKLRTLVEHLILSHHGELEFGSPKLPAFPEALLLHHIDNLDSKMEAMRNAIRRDALAESDFTSWVPSLERALLRKDRYMAETGAPAMQEPLFQSVSTEEPQIEPDPLAENPAPMAAKTVTPVTEPDEVVSRPAESRSKPRPAPVPERPTLFGEKLQAVLGPPK